MVKCGERWHTEVTGGTDNLGAPFGGLLFSLSGTQAMGPLGARLSLPPLRPSPEWQGWHLTTPIG